MAKGQVQRPRPWAPLDNEFLTQDTIVTLGDTFGPAGPLVFLELIWQAHREIPTKSQDFARIEGRYAALARRSFTDVDTAQKVVSAAVDLGLLERVAGDNVRYVVRLAKWVRWESKDPKAAIKKARTRANDS